MKDHRTRFIEDLVRSISSRDPIHGWDHIERVRKLCRRIALAIKQDIDLLALDLAALLHDIGRYIGGQGHHAEVSAAFAEKILRTLGYREELIIKVVDAIASHSYSYGHEPKTIEGKILSDADKIDAIGAIGVARAFMLGGVWGRSIWDTARHFEEKLLKLYDKLYLSESRKIANKRSDTLKRFYEQLVRELSDEVKNSDEDPNS
jgi:uncharacterized protein